jgi:hypothetical protein
VTGQRDQTGIRLLDPCLSRLIRALALEATIRFIPSGPIPVGRDNQHAAYGECVGGKWQFYRFRTSELISIDNFRNVTDSIRVSAHEPGIGRSTGQLALEVLEEIMSKDIAMVRPTHPECLD